MDYKFDKTKELKNLVRKLKFWKYFLLFFLSIIGLFFTLNFSSDKVAAIASNLSASAITGLILSLVYDLFIKRENEISSNLDSEKIGIDISSKILGGYGPDVIPSDQLKDFFEKLMMSDKALHSLARTITDSEERAKTLVAAVLNPLFREPLLIEMDVRNTLRPSEVDNTRYIWELEQRFKIDAPKIIFRCIVTADNDIGSHINAARDGCDALVLISPNASKSIHELLSDAKLSMISEEIVDGARKTAAIPASVNINQVKDLYPDWPIEWSGSVAVVEFSLNNSGTLNLYTLSFQTSNRIDDNFFYWVADRPCHVKSIEIDYSQIRREAGRVAVIPTIAGQSIQTYVDRERGRVGTRADCILWPGQGIFCVWRSHYKNKEESVGRLKS